MHGHIKWTHDTTDPEYNATREAEIGSIYGFAAEEVSGATIGEFVKVGNNVTIDPMRAYLKYTTTAPARSMDGDGATIEMPSSMKVVIVGSNGETTEIGTITNNREPITNNREPIPRGTPSTVVSSRANLLQRACIFTMAERR